MRALGSDTSGAICDHMENALVPSVEDVETRTKHITMLDQDRDLLGKLRAASLSTIAELTWTAAGMTLLDPYRETITMCHASPEIALA